MQATGSGVSCLRRASVRRRRRRIVVLEQVSFLRLLMSGLAFALIQRRNIRRTTPAPRSASTAAGNIYCGLPGLTPMRGAFDKAPAVPGLLIIEYARRLGDVRRCGFKMSRQWRGGVLIALPCAATDLRSLAVSGAEPVSDASAVDESLSSAFFTVDTNRLRRSYSFSVCPVF